jgi:hypothetical protein
VEEEGRKQFLRCTGAFHFAGRPFDQQAGFGSKQRSDGPPAESGPWKARGIRHRRLFTLQ